MGVIGLKDCPNFTWSLAQTGMARGMLVGSHAPDGTVYSLPDVSNPWPDPASLVQAQWFPHQPTEPGVFKLYATTDDEGRVLSMTALLTTFAVPIFGTAIYQPDGTLVEGMFRTIVGSGPITQSLVTNDFDAPVVLPEGDVVLMMAVLYAAPGAYTCFFVDFPSGSTGWWPVPAYLTIREHVGVSEPSPRMAHVLGIRENVGVADRHKDEAACFGRHVRPTWMEGD